LELTMDSISYLIKRININKYILTIKGTLKIEEFFLFL